MVLRKTVETIEENLLAEQAKVTERNVRVIHALGQIAREDEESGSTPSLLVEWYKANQSRVELTENLIYLQGQAETSDVKGVMSESVLELTEIILDRLIEITNSEITTQA